MKATKQVGKAREHLVELMPELTERGLHLEEVDTLGPYWKITFSAAAISPSENSGNLAELLRPRRVQKTVMLQAEDGEFVFVTNPSRAA